MHKKVFEKKKDEWYYFTGSISGISPPLEATQVESV
jgi:hypothetical protein